MPFDELDLGIQAQSSALELDKLCAPAQAEGVDRRIRKTRQRLQAGLLLLMKEKPISQITMREICRRVDVGRSTPYTHYRDVVDILEQMEAALYDELARLMPTYPAAGDVASQRAWFTALYSLAQKNGLLLEVLLCHQGDPPFLKRTLAFCEACIRSANPPATPNLDWRVTFLSGALTSMIRQWVCGGCTESPQELAEITLSFLRTS